MIRSWGRRARAPTAHVGDAGEVGDPCGPRTQARRDGPRSTSGSVKSGGAMQDHAVPKLSAKELGSATGESVERIGRLYTLKLIGDEGHERFTPEDVERVRLIQFLERRQIGLD